MKFLDDLGVEGVNGGVAGAGGEVGIALLGDGDDFGGFAGHREGIFGQRFAAAYGGEAGGGEFAEAIDKLLDGAGVDFLIAGEPVGSFLYEAPRFAVVFELHLGRISESKLEELLAAELFGLSGDRSGHDR